MSIKKLRTEILNESVSKEVSSLDLRVLKKVMLYNNDEYDTKYFADVTDQHGNEGTVRLMDKGAMNTGRKKGKDLFFSIIKNLRASDKFKEVTYQSSDRLVFVRK